MKKRLPSEIRRLFQAWGSKGGKKAAGQMSAEERQERAEIASAAARAKRMAQTPEERSAMAKRAVQARWKAVREKKRKKE